MSSRRSNSPSTLGPLNRIENALTQGPRKKATFQDPLVGHGRHFGRTIHALCRIHAVINNGLLTEAELIAGGSEESLNFDQRCELQIFRKILGLNAKLEDRLYGSSVEEIMHIADLLQKGANGAKSDDTRSLKGTILDWIVPKGQSLSLSRNVKIDRGFRNDVTGALLCPTGLDWEDSTVKEKLRSGELLVKGDEWPVFIYAGCVYNPEDPWVGAFRSQLLVNAYKHIFTSPSSVEKENKATRSGNARIHGMVSVTPASIAYIATQASASAFSCLAPKLILALVRQVRFALSSSSTFSRTDTVTDSERFYNTILATFMDPEEAEEVNQLLQWWNERIFPGQHDQTSRPSNPKSALARIKARRIALKAARPQ